MNVSELVTRVPRFSALSHADRILLFAWYLCRYGNRETFNASDIRRCFDQANVALPSSIPPFLVSMVKRDKPALLRRNGSYVLEQSTLDSLDRKYGQRHATIEIDRLLSDLPSRIAITDERQYLEEAMICLRYKSFRAVIVMTWNLAYSHLCSIILSKYVGKFNAQLPISFPKAKKLSQNRLRRYSRRNHNRIQASLRSPK